MKFRTWCAALVIAGAAGSAPPVFGQAFEIPQPLKEDHHELYEELQAAAQAGGRTGEAAQAAMEALQEHFEKEETYALPQLGALDVLAAMPGAGPAELTPDERRDLVARTARLRAELPQMLKEHEAIAAALQDLQQAARAENKAETARLAQAIMSHARTEELVLYPAALLIGDYLKAMDQAKR